MYASFHFGKKNGSLDMYKICFKVTVSDFGD